MESVWISKIVPCDHPHLEVVRLPGFPLQDDGSVAVRWRKLPEYAFWVHGASEDRGTRGALRFQHQLPETEDEQHHDFSVVCACCKLRHKTKAQLLVQVEFLEAIAVSCKEEGIKTLFGRKAEQASALLGGMAHELSWEEVTEFRKGIRSKDREIFDLCLKETSHFVRVDTR